MKNRVLLPAIIALVGTFTPAQAGNVIWTNLNGGKWSAVTNWSPQQIPGSSDTAIITNSGNYFVTMDISANVGGLTVGASDGTIQTLFNSGQTLNLLGTAIARTNGIFNFNGGSLSGTPTFGGGFLEGEFIFNGGTLSGGLTVASNATINLNGPGSMTFFGPAFTNYGTVNWGNLNLNSSGFAHLVNYGLWDT